MKRNKWCGIIGEADSGAVIQINGWVQRRRDHGALVFVDLRDRTGIVQVVFSPDILAEKFTLAETLRNEDVLAVKGRVKMRPPESVNIDMATGQIELEVLDFNMINKSRPSPLPIEDGIDTREEVRLRYRYLDLRRPEMYQRLHFRHKAAQAIRTYLDEQGFLDIETPYLTRSTPEGARDYLVPSRESPGDFFALPQSPQLFKQLLMVGGIERYYQLARCFRDEDLRGDRQPEFTQLDIEMSFVDEEDIFRMVEGMIRYLGNSLNLAFQDRFPRITHQKALARYGSDKPDTRFGLELNDVSACFADTDFNLFAKILGTGGCIKALNFPTGSKLSRSEIDSLEKIAKKYGAGGLIWLSLQEDDFKSSIKRFIKDEEMAKLKTKLSAKPGDLILMVAGQPKTACEALGQVRLSLGDKYNLYDKSEFQFLWVTEFPLFHYDAEEGRYVAEHHPFTMPLAEDIHKLETDPGLVRARAYDFVVNGVELASGSIRVHDSILQDRLFALLSLSPPEREEKFGFLLEAFQYGAPPHGGIAFGFDRLVMVLTGQETIREVIAFPKTGKAACPVTGAPNRVSEKQLEELGLQLNREKDCR